MQQNLAACVFVFCAITLMGCGTSPIAGMDELRAYRGNVDQPWKVSFVQEVAGSSNEVKTTSESLRRNDVEPIAVYVRPAVVESSVERNTSIYDAQAAAKELTRQVKSSASRWGRFVTVDNEQDAQLAIIARMSMLALEGDTFRSEEELKDSYTGFFGSELSLSRVTNMARDIMRTQITLDYADLTTNPVRGVHSSQITAFYAKRHGELLVEGAIDSTTGRQQQTFDGGLLQPEHLPLLLGQAVDASFVDSFRTIDERFWPDENGKSVRRSSTYANAPSE